MTIAPIANESKGDEQISNQKLYNFVLKGTPVFTGTMIACGCLYAGLNDPESKTLFPQCGFYAVTGWYCPGCGMTRALHNVVTGDLLRAFRYNALLVVTIPVLLYLYVWWVTWSFTGRELPKLKMSKRATVIALTIAAVFIVGRNLPGQIPAFFALNRT